MFDDNNKVETQQTSSLLTIIITIIQLNNSSHIYLFIPFKNNSNDIHNYVNWQQMPQPLSAEHIEMQFSFLGRSTVIAGQWGGQPRFRAMCAPDATQVEPQHHPGDAAITVDQGGGLCKCRCRWVVELSDCRAVGLSICRDVPIDVPVVALGPDSISYSNFHSFPCLLLVCLSDCRPDN